MFVLQQPWGPASSLDSLSRLALHTIGSHPVLRVPHLRRQQAKSTAFPRLRSPPAGMKQGCQACWLRTSSVLRSVLSLELKSSIFCWAGIFSSTCEYLQTQWIGRDTEAGLSDWIHSELRAVTMLKIKLSNPRGVSLILCMTAQQPQWEQPERRLGHR